MSEYNRFRRIVGSWQERTNPLGVALKSYGATDQEAADWFARRVDELEEALARIATSAEYDRKLSHNTINDFARCVPPCRFGGHSRCETHGGFLHIHSSGPCTTKDEVEAQWKADAIKREAALVAARKQA